MRILLVLALSLAVLADWQDGIIDDDQWWHSRDWETIDMISLNPDDLASQYGAVQLWQPVNYHYYDYDSNINDLHKLHTGRRWMVEIDFDVYYKTDVPAGATDDWTNGMMLCAVCFDVKKEDAELKKGHKGIGGCLYQQDDDFFYDANLFGSIEAQGSDSFRFSPDNENDWDIDVSGWVDEYSYGGFWGNGGYFYFVSEPLDVNANTPKHLGIRKEATFLKCYIGQTDSLDSSDIFETDISLADFTTDKPRRADLTCIEDAASRLFAGLSLLIALIA